MLKLFIPFFIVSTVFFLSNAIAIRKEKGCNFSCQHIPPLEDSLIQSGQAQWGSLPKQFNVLVWNIYKGKKAGWEKDFLSLSSKVDLMLVQEFLSNTKSKNIIDQIIDFHSSFAISFFMTSNLPTGIINFSRATPTRTLPQRTTHREPFAQTPKMNLIQSFPIEGTKKNVTVINIHGINFTGNKPFTDQLKLVEPYLKKSQGPVIFAGDFNTWNSFRQNILDNFAQKHHLKKAHWPGHRNGLNHAYFRGLTIKKSLLLKEIKSSDHFPLYLELALPSPQ